MILGECQVDRYIIQDLFGIKGFNIAWYGVIIASGMLLGVILASYRAKKKGFKTDLILDFIFVALPIAIICARLYYVLFEWGEYSDNLLKIFAVREGGLAIYGGVIGGLLTAIIFCRFNKFPFLTLADLAIPSLLLGQAIGRWGNFMNQEAYGELITNTKLQFFPYAVYIKDLSEWHQATFFYESTWNLLIFLILIVLSVKVRKDGLILATYCIGYGLGRFFIEGLRTDSLYIFHNIRISQVLSLAIIFVGIGLLILIKKGIIKVSVYHGKYSL